MISDKGYMKMYAEVTNKKLGVITCADKVLGILQNFRNFRRYDLIGLSCNAAIQQNFVVIFFTVVKKVV